MCVNECHHQCVCVCVCAVVYIGHVTRNGGHAMSALLSHKGFRLVTGEQSDMSDFCMSHLCLQKLFINNIDFF